MYMIINQEDSRAPSQDRAPGQELPWPQLICEQNRGPAGLSGAGHGPQQACLAMGGDVYSTAPEEEDEVLLSPEVT
ncbi:unnamed protein product [Boreogadus saida]